MDSDMKGQVYVLEETNTAIACKYMSWLAVMLAFMILLIWFSRQNYGEKCNFGYPKRRLRYDELYK